MAAKRPKLKSSAPAAAAGRLDRMLGAHLAAGPGLVKAADRAAAVGAMGLQIFTGNPTGWARRAELPKELPAFRARMKEHGFGPLAVHAAYLANLADLSHHLRSRNHSIKISIPFLNSLN
jgi:endonuclease IV